MEKYLILHEKALSIANQYRVLDSDLIDVLQELGQDNGFLKLGYKHAFDYMIRALRFTEDKASNFNRVSRVCVTVPELKMAIQNQSLNVSTARRIVTVLTETNKMELIEKAIRLPQRKLEQEVAKINPKAVLREKSKIITEDLVENRYNASNEEESEFERVLDLESQRLKKSVSRQEAIRTMVKHYLKINDPIEKAKRNISKTPASVARLK